MTLFLEFAKCAAAGMPPGTGEMGGAWKEESLLKRQLIQPCPGPPPAFHRTSSLPARLSSLPDHFVCGRARAIAGLCLKGFCDFNCFLGHKLFGILIASHVETSLRFIRRTLHNSEEFTFRFQENSQTL